MKKLVRTSLNNVANKRGVRDLNIQLYSHDKNNAGFEFVIKNEVDLSEYKAKVLFDFQESFATWETKGTIEGNVVKVKFDTTFITKCEEVIGYLFLDSETDTLDVFKFKFNVVLSEIDKYDLAKRGFRYIKDQEVVDVITRSELQEELAKIQVTGGVDLSGYLTTTAAEEMYAKKTDLPTPYNDSALVERVTSLENKTDRDTVYDDTSVKERLTTLENKPPVDLSNYATKDELANLSGSQPTVDTSNLVTRQDLEDKHYATEQSLNNYALKSEIPTPYNDSELVQKIGQLEARVDKDTVYDDAPLKERVTALESKAIEGGAYDDTDLRNRVVALENKPTVDATHFITEETLESKGFLTTHQDISNLATKEELDKRVTKEELEEKHYVTNEQISSTYATKSEIPQPYSDTELVKRITVLENRQDNDTVYDDAELKRRVTALENSPSVSGGTQTQDTGWIKLSNDNPLNGNVVKIRRINDTVHVRIYNENNYGLVAPANDENDGVYTILEKNIQNGFKSDVSTVEPVVSAIGNIEGNPTHTEAVGVMIYKIQNGQLSIILYGRYLEGMNLHVNEFSYITDEPFPVELQK